MEPITMTLLQFATIMGCPVPNDVVHASVAFQGMDGNVQVTVTFTGEQ